MPEEFTAFFSVEYLTDVNEFIVFIRIPPSNTGKDSR